MRFAVLNLGCKVNRVESDFYEKKLSELGYLLVKEDADLVIVNTCTVTGEAEKKTRKAVRQMLKRHPKAQVIVTGCASAINPDMFRDMSDRVVVVEKARSFEYVSSLEAIEGTASLPDGPPISYERVNRRTRVGVKVQDGCDNACTYCIVHVARGKAVSRPLEEIVDEVIGYASAGAREIVLSGINIGSYSYGEARLAELLRILLEATENLHEPEELPVRFRVSSIEPNDVSDDFIELLAKADGRICRHLHLPLQAGSSKVLREMARPYDAEDFRRLVDFIRAMVPSISLSTDIIVGFPGESDDEFQETVDLARYCGFSKIHVFPYSKRQGTPAAERMDQVQPEVKSRRAAELRALSDELRGRDYCNRSGETENVLVEQQGRAMTESYYEIQAPTDFARGELRPYVLPDTFLEDSLLAD